MFPVTNPKAAANCTVPNVSDELPEESYRMMHPLGSHVSVYRVVLACVDQATEVL